MKNLLPFAILLFAIISGCAFTESPKMRSAKNLPTNSQKLHPWIAEIRGQEPKRVIKTIQQRLTDTDSAALLQLAKRVAEFTPYSLEYSEGNTYVFCTRLDSQGHLSGDVVDCFYVSQPPDPADLEKRLAYFDSELQPLLSSFWSKYAGAGEEMEGKFAGQFVLRDTAASDYDSDSFKRFGKWKDSKVLYHARNGDLLLIESNGGTAWYVMETGKVEPLTATFPEFLKHYTAFLGSDVFDSWNSRDFLKKPQLKIHR